MAKREIGTRLKLDGEAEYSAAIKNINQNLKVFASEMAATTSAIDKNNVSISDLRAKGEIYNKQIDAQRQKLDVFNKAVEEARKVQENAAAELEKLTEEYGANSKEVQAAERRLAAATAKLNDYQIGANYVIRSINQLEAAQRSNNEAIAQMENSVDDAERAINRYDEALDDAGQSVIDFGDLVKANIASDLISSAFEKATENSSKELLAMAERVGFSAQAYQEWDYIAKQAGTTMETLQGGITDLAEKMDDAASGTGEAAEIFAQLGLSVTDSTGKLKDQERMFTEVVLALQNVEDASKRQALATKLMSTTGEELLPLLNGQIGSIDELKRSAHEMGAVLSDTALNDMATMENSFENLETKGINAATALVSKAAPLFSKMADFATENTDAIIALLSAYAAFTGANAIGNGIMTLVRSMKALKTANDAATVSQTAMNAAAAANPYVLVASAIAAVVAGLAIYATTADDVGNKIKDINKTVEQLQQNTQDTIADTEAEIKVIERKSERYEELRSIVNRTAAEESELANLARELQTLLPEGTTLINEQSGAYLSLAGSIDTVIESMRQQATMNAYQEEYTELIKQQLEAEKAMEDAANEVYEKTMESQRYPKLPAFTGFNALAQAELLNAQGNLKDAEDNLNNISDRLSDIEGKVKGVYEASAETAKQMAEDGEEVQEIVGDGLSGSLETYEENLQAKVDSLDKSLKLRKKSEEQYYAELKKYLDENKNEESTLYFEMLSRYENYCKGKADAASSANGKIVKSTQDAIDAEQTTLEKSLEEITNSYESALGNIRSKVDSFKSSISGSFTSMLTFEKAGGDAVLPSFEEMRKRAQELGMMYQEYINSDKYNEDIKNAHWGRTEEYIDKAYATNKIKTATAELEDYLDLVDGLRSRGISDGLVSQLQSMSIEEGMATAKYYASLSDAQLQALEKNWKRYNETAEKLASELYSEEIEAATDTYLSQVEDKLASCAPDMKEAGLKIVQSLVAGFSDKEQSEQVLQKLDEMFGNAKKEGEVSGYDAGYLFDLNMASGIDDNSHLITEAINRAVNNASFNMDDVMTQYPLNTSNAPVTSSQANQNGSGETTIINMYQTNTSPKHLSAADSYRNTVDGLTLAAMRK